MVLMCMRYLIYGKMKSIVYLCLICFLDNVVLFYTILVIFVFMLKVFDTL